MAKMSLPDSRSRRMGTRKAEAPMSTAITGAVIIRASSSSPSAEKICGPEHQSASATTMIQMAACSWAETGPRASIFFLR